MYFRMFFFQTGICIHSYVAAGIFTQPDFGLPFASRALHMSEIKTTSSENSTAPKVGGQSRKTLSLHLNAREALRTLGLRVHVTSHSDLRKIQKTLHVLKLADLCFRAASCPVYCGWLPNPQCCENFRHTRFSCYRVLEGQSLTSA